DTEGEAVALWRVERTFEVARSTSAISVAYWVLAALMTVLRSDCTRATSPGRAASELLSRLTLVTSANALLSASTSEQIAGLSLLQPVTTNETARTPPAARHWTERRLIMVRILVHRAAVGLALAAEA